MKLGDKRWSMIFQDFLEKCRSRIGGNRQRQLEKLAFEDSITGGMNNAAFQRKYQKLVCENPSGCFSIVLLNVRRFKLVNEKLGFGAGNEVLRMIYQEFDKQMDKTRNEFAARSEMDNFFLCLNEKGKKQIRERVRSLEDAVNQSLGEKYPGTYLTFTAGCCLAGDGGLDIRIVQDCARIAAEDESVTVKEGCAFYSNLLAERIKREQELETAFEKSIQEHEFQVYLQPKVDLNNGCLSGAEALVRWNHPTLGFISPCDFIPLLERTGKICQLDFYVFKEICKFYKRWMEKGMRRYPISVNLSRYHFYEEDFLDKFYEVFQEYGLPENSIEFELTESMFFDRAYNEYIKKGIARMHELGFCCSMDDFGAGYSSLGILKEFDVDTIKMDRLFFLDMDNEKARDIIQSVVELAAKLQMKTVAEGIEETEQMEFLDKVKCDAVQGFFFSRPLPMDEFEGWVSHYEQDRIFSSVSYSTETSSGLAM